MELRLLREKREGARFRGVEAQGEKIGQRLKAKGIKQKLKAEEITANSNVKFSVIN